MTVVIEVAVAEGETGEGEGFSTLMAEATVE